MATKPPLKQLLKTSLSNQTAVPNNLESRILQAIHTEQTREIAHWRRLRLIGLTSLTAIFLGSLGVFAYRFLHSDTLTIIQTFLMNRDVLAWQDGALALIETLPIGSIAVASTILTLLCLLLSIRIPKPTLHSNIHTHNLLYAKQA